MKIKSRARIPYSAVCAFVASALQLTTPLAPAVAQPVAPTLLEPAPALPAVAPDGAHVELFLQIEADGALSAVDVGAISAPDAARAWVEARAIEAARALRFAPARVDGEPVAVRIRFVVTFPAPEPGVAAQDDREPRADTATAREDPEAAAPSDASASERNERNERNEASEPTDDDDDEDALGDGPEGPGFGAEAVVDPNRRTREATSASDLDIEVGGLRRVPRMTAQSFLTLAPGMLLTQHGAEGHAMSMFLRGFDAAEGEDLELLVDGLPLNEISNAHGHGYADMTFVIPQAIRGVRMIQGPFDPMQGDFATAGTAELVLGFPEDQRGVHLSLGYGRFGETRLFSAWAPAGEREGTFGAFAFNRGDGFGPNRAFRNGSVMLRYEHALDAKTIVHALGFGALASFRSAGVVREDDVRLGRMSNCGPSPEEQLFCFYDPNQGGSSGRGGATLGLRRQTGNRRLELALGAQRRNLRLQENFTGFVTDPRTDGGPQRGDNLDQRYEATTLFARGRYALRALAFGQRQDLEVGMVLRHDAAETLADRRRDRLAVPYRTEFDRAVRQTHVGAYLRGDVRPTAWLSLLGGARVDYFGFDVVDRNFPPMDAIGERLPRAAYSAHGVAVSPRGTLRLRLLEGLDWITAFGLGARSSDAAALSEAELAPFARVTALESGLVFERELAGVALEGRLTAFATRISQDLVFDPTAGRNSVLGPSARSGAALQARARIGDWLDVQGSVTYTRGHLQTADAGTFALFDGPRLPFVPAWLARLDAVARHELDIGGQPFSGSAALGFTHVGKRPLPFAQLADPYTLVDLALSVGWRTYELGLTLQNLFDARYRSTELHYASNFRDPSLPASMTPTRHYSVGAPRTFLVTLSGRFAGEPEP